MTMLMRAGFCVALLLTATVVRADKVDDYIRTQMRTRKIPGLALAVVRDGKVIKAKGYGVSDIENDVPVTPDSVFELASVTKQFTATAIMILVEEGKIRLDDKISKYLNDAPKTWKDITVQHLLTHTSGLPGLENCFKSLVWTPDVSTQSAYEAAQRDKIDFAPGERYQYSDVGYFLLGKIVEQVSGKKYRDFLADRIFKPLEMTSTSVLDLYTPLKHRVRGYVLYKGPQTNDNETLLNIQRQVQFELPSQYGIFSTVKDLAKWDAALYSNKIVKQSTLAQMWTPVKFNDGTTYPYGFAWEVESQKGHRRIGHTGITGTEITRYPDDRLTVITLTNLGRWGDPFTLGAYSWGMTQTVAGFYVPELAYRPIPDKEPQITALVKTLYEKRAEGDWDEKLFAPSFWAIVKPILKDGEYYRSLGPVKSVTLVDRKDEGVTHLYWYRVTYRQVSRLVTLTLNERGKIANLQGTTE